MNKEELLIVTCPPLSDYPEAPKDQSKSDLFDCPECKNKMWLSEKKKGILLFASCLNRDIMLACYQCFEKEVRDNPEFFRESQQVNI